MTEAVAAMCPACGGIVGIETLAVGATLECPECNSLLEVTGLEPLELVRAEDEVVVPYPDEDEYGTA
ncbi:MAG TPA: hypothetical protein VKY42_04780 [Trueperaceae bacterium]|nr:hypothetical protein [Trueperaceae bacterium]